MTPEWICRVYRSEPESRWWYRVVLRRRLRYVQVWAGMPELMSLTRTLNVPSEMKFVAPLDLLSRCEYPIEH